MKHCVREHFERFLGAPVSVLADGDPVSIVVWRDSESESEVLVSTVGMATTAQQVPPGMRSLVRNPRTEILMVARRGEERAMGELLLELSLFPRMHGTFLHWGHDIALGIVARGTGEISHVYFTVPPIEDPQFSTFLCSGNRIDVLWAIPITSAEQALKVSQGGEALESLLEDVDIADLRRSSAV